MATWGFCKRGLLSWTPRSSGALNAHVTLQFVLQRMLQGAI